MSTVSTRFWLKVLAAVFVVFSATASAVSWIVYLQFQYDAVSAKKNRKRDLDAYVIASALVHYQKDHEGQLPSSLEALEIKDELANDMYPAYKVDLSPFHLLTVGTHSGKRDTEVAVEAPDYQPPPSWHAWIHQEEVKAIVRIYRDGEVRYETAP